MTLKNNPVKRLVVVKQDNGALQVSVIGDYSNTLRFKESKHDLLGDWFGSGIAGYLGAAKESKQ